MFPLLTSASLVFCLVGLTGFSTWVLLQPTKAIAKYMDIIQLPTGFKVQLLVIAVINIILCFAFERYAERPIARSIALIKRWARRARRNEGNHYKSIEGSMGRSRRLS